MSFILLVMNGTQFLLLLFLDLANPIKFLFKKDIFRYKKLKLDLKFILYELKINNIYNINNIITIIIL